MKAPYLKLGVIKIIEWMVIILATNAEKAHHTDKVACLLLLTDGPNLLIFLFYTKMLLELMAFQEKAKAFPFVYSILWLL